MTQEEIKLYTELNKKFIKECERIAKHFARINTDYRHITDWEIVADEVHGWGEVYSRNCYMGTENVYFDLEFLQYTDEELETYVNDVIKKKEEEAEEAKRKNKEDERNRELATLKRLKEKYGDISL